MEQMMNISADHGAHHDHTLQQGMDHASMNHHMDRGGVSPDHANMDHSAHQTASAATNACGVSSHAMHGMSVWTLKVFP